MGIGEGWCDPSNAFAMYSYLGVSGKYQGTKSYMEKVNLKGVLDTYVLERLRGEE